MNSASIAIVIPSYNEGDNLAILIPSIFMVAPECHVIVVDDSESHEKEKTSNVIQAFKNDHILLLHRDGKGGRGSAVIDGMKEALKNEKTAIIVEMDADLAHDPKELPRLLSKIPPADMVIGSRYMTTSTIVDWPARRLIQSKMINFFLKFWLGLNITDYTNGYRAYTRESCMYLTSILIHEKGFISLSEVAYRLRQKGFQISEVPITFTDRKFGTSNADWRELLTSFIGVIRIRLRKEQVYQVKSPSS